MAEDKRGEGQRGSSGGSSSGNDEQQQQTGDPGRTPGTAEGDRETVEEDLANRGGDRK